MNKPCPDCKNKPEENYYLISFRRENQGQITYGCEIAENQDPFEWLVDVQTLPGTFILLNAQPITKEQAKNYWGELKGM